MASSTKEEKNSGSNNEGRASFFFPPSGQTLLIFVRLVGGRGIGRMNPPPPFPSTPIPSSLLRMSGRLSFCGAFWACSIWPVLKTQISKKFLPHPFTFCLTDGAGAAAVCSHFMQQQYGRSSGHIM